MIEIKLEESSSIVLEMEIEGNVKNDNAELRFTVVSEGIRYSFSGREIEKGVYSVDFPKMLGKIEEGEYHANVEIIVDGRYFTPLTESVRFTKEIKPVVKMNEEVKKDKAEPMSVKIGSIKTRPEIKKEAVREIHDVKGIISALVVTENSSHHIDTSLALACLESLVSNKIYETAEFRVNPARPASEAEVLATLKMIERHGSDIKTLGNIKEIMAISERVRGEVRNLLIEKGVSARDLKTFL